MKSPQLTPFNADHHIHINIYKVAVSISQYKWQKSLPSVTNINLIIIIIWKIHMRTHRMHTLCETKTDVRIPLVLIRCLEKVDVVGAVIGVVANMVNGWGRHINTQPHLFKYIFTILYRKLITTVFRRILYSYKAVERNARCWFVFVKSSIQM